MEKKRLVAGKGLTGITALGCMFFSGGACFLFWALIHYGSRSAIAVVGGLIIGLLCAGAAFACGVQLKNCLTYFVEVGSEGINIAGKQLIPWDAIKEVALESKTIKGKDGERIPVQYLKVVHRDRNTGIENTVSFEDSPVNNEDLHATIKRWMSGRSLPERPVLLPVSDFVRRE